MFPASCGRPLAAYADGGRQPSTGRSSTSTVPGTDRSLRPRRRFRMPNCVRAWSVWSRGQSVAWRAAQPSVDHPPAPHRRRTGALAAGGGERRLAWQTTGEHPPSVRWTGCAPWYAGGARIHRARSRQRALARHGVKPSLTSTVSGRSGHWKWPPVCLAPSAAQRLGLDRNSLSFAAASGCSSPDVRWKTEARRHYARLCQLPAKASDPHPPLLARVRTGIDAVARCHARRIAARR